MKIAYSIARLLLGVIFLFFGSNMFLNFLHAPMPTGILGQFSGALFVSHYIYAVAFFQVVPAILLLANRYVPLALTMLAPVIVNICLVHILMAPSGLPMAALVVVLWLLTFYRVRSAFAGLFQQRVPDAA
jgi:putative oxidoreductase